MGGKLRCPAVEILLYWSATGVSGLPSGEFPEARCVFRSQSVYLTNEVPPSDTSVWRAVVRVLRSTVGLPLDSLTTVVFPADCRVCGLPLSGFTFLPVCDSCWKNLPAQSGALCQRCGESLQAEPLPDLLCRACHATPPPFDRAVAHGVYDRGLRTLLHLLKYDGMSGLAGRLGALLAEHALAIPDLPDDLLLVPVPLHPGKRRRRGFNQAELLARGAMAAMSRRRPGMRIRVAAGALERQRATESQTGLTPHQRRANVRGVFSVPGPAAVKGQNVLLVDDIYTTGATARSCAKALRAAGAAAVWVATVARAQRMERMEAQEVAAANENAAELPMDQDIAFWDEEGNA